jgi:hypothetical protein
MGNSDLGSAGFAMMRVSAPKAAQTAAAQNALLLCVGQLHLCPQT